MWSAIYTCHELIDQKKINWRWRYLNYILKLLFYEDNNKSCGIPEVKFGESTMYADLSLPHRDRLFLKNPRLKNQAP